MKRELIEEWRPIPSYEGKYSVSNLGAIRSEERRIHIYGGRYQVRSARIMKPRNKGRYMCVELYEFGAGHWFGVHTLVAAAFIGPRPDGMFVCHNDGNRAENSMSNLRYDTPSANQADRKKHGTNIGPRGDRSGTAKLTWDQVRAIREDRRSSYQIAPSYNVTPAQVARIKRGENWSVEQ